MANQARLQQVSLFSVRLLVSNKTHCTQSSHPAAFLSLLD